MTQCVELCIMTVKAEMVAEFVARIEPQIKKECLAKFDGLLSTDILRSVDADNVFVHNWTWSSEEAAKKAAEAFPSLASAAEFMSCFENVTMHHLLKMA